MNQLFTGRNLTTQYPELGTGPVPVDIYHEPAVYEKEIEAIFKRSWHLVGRVDQVAEPGAFFVRTLPIFGHSILICRNKDGAINGFHNVCQHRGSVVQHRDDGRCSVFTCRFHGWSYDLNGNLLRVRDEEGFANLDKSGLRLKPIATDVWQGFIFVHLEDEPRQNLEDYMGEQGADLAGYPFALGTQCYQYEAEINCNWKLLVDSFSECYHIPVLHLRSIGPTMTYPDNPNGRLQDVCIKGPHRTVSYRSSMQGTSHPVQALAYANQASPSLVSAQATDFALPKGLNQLRADDWFVDVQVFFPGLLFVLASGMYVVHQVWPLAANRCHYVKRGYLRKAENAAQRFGQENSQVEFRDLILEDLNTLERIQRAMETGKITEFHYHDHEVALRHQHHVVCERLKRYDAEQAVA
jgi:phenylpropionate dioxygenase-like ring-hydroxylating dioxygenase large terminal subunit